MNRSRLLGQTVHNWKLNKSENYKYIITILRLCQIWSESHVYLIKIIKDRIFFNRLNIFYDEGVPFGSIYYERVAREKSKNEGAGDKNKKGENGIIIGVKCLKIAIFWLYTIKMFTPPVASEYVLEKNGSRRWGRGLIIEIHNV